MSEKYRFKNVVISGRFCREDSNLGPSKNSSHLTAARKSANSFACARHVSTKMQRTRAIQQISSEKRPPEYWRA